MKTLLFVTLLVVALFSYSNAISSEQCREVCGGIEDFQCIRRCMSNQRFLQRRETVHEMKPLRMVAAQSDKTTTALYRPSTGNVRNGQIVYTTPYTKPSIRFIPLKDEEKAKPMMNKWNRRPVGIKRRTILPPKKPTTLLPVAPKELKITKVSPKKLNTLKQLKNLKTSKIAKVYAKKLKSQKKQY
jgi:hypothetical protein